MPGLAGRRREERNPTQIEVVLYWATDDHALLLAAPKLFFYQEAPKNGTLFSAIYYHLLLKAGSSGGGRVLLLAMLSKEATKLDRLCKRVGKLVDLYSKKASSHIVATGQFCTYQ